MTGDRRGSRVVPAAPRAMGARCVRRGRSPPNSARRRHPEPQRQDHPCPSCRRCRATRCQSPRCACIYRTCERTRTRRPRASAARRAFPAAVVPRGENSPPPRRAGAPRGLCHCRRAIRACLPASSRSPCAAVGAKAGLPGSGFCGADTENSRQNALAGFVNRKTRSGAPERAAAMASRDDSLPADSQGPQSTGEQRSSTESPIVSEAAKRDSAVSHANSRRECISTQALPLGAPVRAAPAAVAGTALLLLAPGETRNGLRLSHASSALLRNANDERISANAGVEMAPRHTHLPTASSAPRTR